MDPTVIHGDDQFVAGMRQKITESAQSFLDDPDLKDLHEIPVSVIMYHLLSFYTEVYGEQAVQPYIPMLEMSAYVVGQRVKELRNVAAE